MPYGPIGVFIVAQPTQIIVKRSANELKIDKIRDFLDILLKYPTVGIMTPKITISVGKMAENGKNYWKKVIQ